MLLRRWLYEEVRYEVERWPLWRLLGIHRDGKVLYCAVEWLR